MALAAGGKHEGGENTEQGGLAAAVGAEQSEEFGGADVEGNAVEGGAILVAVNEILNGDDGVRAAAQRRLRGAATSRTGTLVATDHSTRTFYDETG